MKNLLLAIPLLLFLGCHTPKSPSIPIEKSSFLLKGTINCKIIQKEEMYTRVQTDTFVKENDLKTIADSLKIKTTAIYFHIPNFGGRGEEYAALSGGFPSVYGGFDTNKLLNDKANKEQALNNNIKKYGIRDEDFARKAYVISQDFVKRELISPKSADFPLLDYKFSNVIENAIVIESYVDSKNSFGTEIRNNYTIKLKKVGNNWADIDCWSLVSLNFE